MRKLRRKFRGVDVKRGEQVTDLVWVKWVEGARKRGWGKRRGKGVVEGARKRGWGKGRGKG
eukprot:308223-Chlamydomonas_euryale.AAC.1